MEGGMGENVCVDVIRKLQQVEDDAQGAHNHDPITRKSHHRQPRIGKHTHQPLPPSPPPSLPAYLDRLLRSDFRQRDNHHPIQRNSNYRQPRVGMHKHKPRADVEVLLKLGVEGLGPGEELPELSRSGGREGRGQQANKEAI